MSKEKYTFVSDNYYFAIKERMGGLDVYDKETDKFIRPLDGFTMAQFTYDGKVDDSKIYDAIELEDDWDEYQRNMFIYGSPT